jgi:hypothetical protein
VRTTKPQARRHDDGYATAEAAVALPALLVVLALAVGVVVSVGAQLRCVDAARVAARVAARGDSDGAAERAGIGVAPGGAHVRIVRRAGDVEVEVSADVRPFGSALRLFPPVHVSARAVAELESP